MATIEGDIVYNQFGRETTMKSQNVELVSTKITLKTRQNVY